MIFPFFRRRGQLEKASADHLLQFPISATDRIAVISPNFRLSTNARRFTTRDKAAIEAYCPQGLVATFHDACALAPLELEHVLVILTLAGQQPLSNQDRDVLWSEFRVPVYEQLLAPNGMVIARECEVHEGLHAEEEHACIPADLTGDVVREHCECGRETPRLRNLRERPCRHSSSRLAESSVLGNPVLHATGD